MVGFKKKKSALVVLTKTIAVYVGLGLLGSCSYITPEAENPSPGLEDPKTLGLVQDGTLSIRKEFFGIEIDQKNNTVNDTKKNWMCGWAPLEMGGVSKGGLTAVPYKTGHCNVRFRITDDGQALEAREYNVDYPENINKWQILVTIPIKAHYFYEKDVDARGRELNKYKKVSDRKNWKLMPFIDLDLSAIDFVNKSRGPYGWSGTKVTEVHDVEFVKTQEGNSFLAFNGTAVLASYGSYIQQKIRFNFLEFQENPNFKKTPYDNRNARFMNILHVLGERPNGFDEINYAAHWDVSEPVEICLNGFPEDSRNYKQIAYDVIDEVNQTFEKIGAVKKGQKAFVASKWQPKYMFDLRCPSIVWVEDPNLSLNAPLGIGLVNTNIKTGQILWGTAVVWGGLMDYLVNRDSPAVVSSINRNTREQLSKIEDIKNNPYFMDINSQIDLTKFNPGFKNLNDFIKESGKNYSIKDVLQGLSNTENQIKDKDKDQFITRMKSLLSQEKYNEILANDVYSNILLDENFNNSFASTLKNEDYINFLKSNSKLFADVKFSEEKESLSSLQESLLSGKRVQDPRAGSGVESTLADFENTLDRHIHDWNMAVAQMGSFEKQAAAKSVIKNVMLHEWGHVMNLGHQFEGNRLPEKGFVPDKVYNFLAEEAKDQHQYSSVMDYQNGKTEVNLPYEKVKMQEQDRLVLTYLYKQEYSTYRQGDEDFKFFPVPANGVIPDVNKDTGKDYVTQYMPQCSDFGAWMHTSAYCKRWDRGMDAPDMVQENIDQYTNNLISTLNAFTDDAGKNAFNASYRLFNQTYDVMNSNRTFYDQMRYQLATHPVYKNVYKEIIKDEIALNEFSEACVDPLRASGADRKLKFTKLTLKPVRGKSRKMRSGLVQEDIGDEEYKNLLNKYENVVKETKTSDLLRSERKSLEDKLYEKGVAFTELHELCLATKKSLDFTKTLLSLKGPDQADMDYESSIYPTGMRGGNATTDYSKVFGTYNQLGLLPLKLATLDVFTNVSSTFKYGWWNLPKPQFADPNIGKYGYFSLFPKEFTDIVGTSVRNNMGFGGTVVQDTATMSLANLYMSYFLFRTFFMSNDGQARGFRSNYIDNLKAQTEFKVIVGAVLLKTIKIDGKPTNKRFGVRPQLYNLAKRELTDLTSAYLLPDSKVIIAGNENQIILPMGKVRFISQDEAFVWVVEVTYDKASYDDSLKVYSIKNAIQELTNQEMFRCVGVENGLKKFFDNPDSYEGFDVANNIATDKLAQDNFEASIDRIFNRYHEEQKPEQRGCEESVKGIGLITSTALSLNGVVLPQAFDYIKK